MVRKIVYIDLDSTLANFEKMALAFVGFDGKDFKNIPKDLLSESQRQQQKLLFKVIDENPHFFKYEEPYPFSQQLYFECKKLFDEVKILSNYVPPKNDYSVLYQVQQYKSEWVLKYIDKNIIPQNIIITNIPKYKYARPNTWLIDDMKHNIDTWNEAGGNGILFTNWKTVYKQLQKLKGKIR